MKERSTLLLIAGAIAVFVSQASVLKYFGARASKILSYSVASVGGLIGGSIAIKSKPQLLKILFAVTTTHCSGYYDL
ncbi:MAG: hypothetical protein J7L53_07205 [Deltaproteobacteria bacterium]|nr:hypothetical protein [Deltaproteobacteria bacterium]